MHDFLVQEGEASIHGVINSSACVHVMVMADAPTTHHAINITRTKVNRALVRKDGGSDTPVIIPCALEGTVSTHSKHHVHIFISV